MADIKEVGGAVGGTSVIDDNVADSVKILSEDLKAYVQIDTTDSAEKLILAGGGAKVGINNVDPEGQLHIVEGTESGVAPETNIDTLVVDNAAGAGIAVLSGNNVSGSLAFRSENAGGTDSNTMLVQGLLTSAPNYQGKFRLMAGTTNSDFLDFETAGASRLRITGEGKISTGGQDTPMGVSSGSLHVYTGSSTLASASTGADDFVIEGSADTGMTILSGGNNRLSSIFFACDDANGSGWVRYTHNATPASGSMAVKSNGYTFFETGGENERMRIDANGLVGIGITNTTNRFHVKTTANEGLAKFEQDGDNQATCFVLSTKSVDRGPAYFTTTSGSFDDGTNYPIIRVVTSRSESANIGMIGCYTHDGVPQFLVAGDGKVSAGTTFQVEHSDYAEYFETTDGGSIAVGSSVVLDGGKVRAAQAGEQPMGIVRPPGTTSVVGNDPWRFWKDRYLRDDFGTYVKVPYTITEWTTDEGAFHSYATDMIPDDAIPPDDATILSTDKHGDPWVRNVENPDYDDSLEYVKREHRDEWVIVGLLGQIPISKGQPVADSWVKLRDVSDSVEMYFIK